MSAQVPSRPMTDEEPHTSRWATSLVLFAGVVVMVAGVWHALSGLRALVNDKGLRPDARVHLHLRPHRMGLDPHPGCALLSPPQVSPSCSERCGRASSGSWRRSA
jgi:hypothetical protein